MTATPRKKKVDAQPQVSGFGLAGIGNLSGMLTSINAFEVGGPLDLSMDLIDEDPHQPRTEDNPGFSAASLAELAATIRLRGVKTPVSVRDHPKEIQQREGELIYSRIREPQ